MKGANSAPFFLLAVAELGGEGQGEGEGNGGSFDGTAYIFASSTISRYKVFPASGHSLSSFCKIHPVPAARKIAANRKPVWK